MYIKRAFAFFTPFLFPLFALAADFVPLSPNLPVDTKIDWFTSPGKFLNTIFGIAVFGSATLAVVMIAFGGVQWMLSSTPMKISDGKDRIQNAIIGLVVVLSAVLVLKTINPNIINLGFFTTYIAPDP